MDASRIVTLASQISKNTARIDRYLTAHKLPFPSFHIQGPTSLELSDDVENARSVVLDATLELYNLLLGPKGILHNQVVSRFQYLPDIHSIHNVKHNNLVSLHAISNYHIASAFPIDQEATFKDVALGCGLHEPDVRRMLRHAATNHIFKEVRKGVIIHTAASRMLAEDSQMRDWVAVNCEEMWPAAERVE